MNFLPLPLSFLLILVPSLGLAADNYTAPKTEWGLPDLQGVWNFSSNTPMQRPSQFGTRQYLTDEEVAEQLSRSAASDAASDAAIPGTGVDEAYNDFWIESAGLGRAQQTSLKYILRTVACPHCKVTLI